LVSANAVVVFDGGGKESEAPVRAARDRKVALRVINVRAFVMQHTRLKRVMRDVR
jgi:hypothetical protein